MNKMMRNRVIGMICVLAVALSAVSFNVEAVTEEENTVLALTLEEVQQLAIEKREKFPTQKICLVIKRIFKMSLNQRYRKALFK